MNQARKLLAAAALAVAASGAQAALTTGFTADTVFDFETVVGGPGPVVLNADVTLTGFGHPADTLEVGAPAFWDLGENGFWSLGKTFAGNNTAIGGMLVQFNGTTVQSVGAVFNYLAAPAGNPLQLLALDVDGNVLEGHSITIGTVSAPPGGAVNAGEFYGITRATADIGALVITAPFVVMDDLSYTAPIPEPSTYAMVFGGLGLLALARRRAARR